MPDSTARGIEFPVDPDPWDYQGQQEAMAETADAAIANIANIATLVAFSRAGLGQTASIASGGGWSRPFVPDVLYNEDVTTMSYDGTFRAVVVAVDALVAYSCYFTLDSNGSDGRREITIARYNSAETQLERRALNGTNAPAGGSEISLAANWTFKCSAGDMLAMECRQFSGGTAANLSATGFVATVNRKDG